MRWTALTTAACVVFVCGCVSTFEMPPLLITHPANPLAEEAQPYQFTTTLNNEPPASASASGPASATHEKKEMRHGEEEMKMDREKNHAGEQEHDGHSQGESPKSMPHSH